MKPPALRGRSGQKQPVSMGGFKRCRGSMAAKDPINSLNQSVHLSLRLPVLSHSEGETFRSYPRVVKDASCQKSGLADRHAGKSQAKSVLAVEPKHCSVYVKMSPERSWRLKTARPMLIRPDGAHLWLASDVLSKICPCAASFSKPSPSRGLIF